MTLKFDLKSIVLILFIMSIYIYKYPMINHITNQGVTSEVDLNELLMTIMGLFILLSILPVFDKNKVLIKRINAYNDIVFSVILILATPFLLILIRSTGTHINPQRFFGLIIAVAFIIMSNYLPKLSMNTIAGIRTPWSMTSEAVWKKTHHISGIIGVILGTILFVIHALVANKELLSMTIYVIVGWLVLTVVISYFVCRHTPSK